MTMSTRARTGRFLPLLLAASLAGSAFVAFPVAGAGAASGAAAGAGGAGVAGGPAASKPFRMDLYRKGDFVSQTNLVQCVGASMQMMLNMMRPVDDRTAAFQLELQNLARKWSPRRFPGAGPTAPTRPRRGASSRGWAFGLTLLGYGPYRLTGFETVEAAVESAALAMRRTGRPAGLLVWQGAHAWVMSGFEARADPLLDASADVTHVFVLDPLYPRTSSVWGPSPAPDSRLSLDVLDADFVPWRPTSSSAMAGRFVVVLPLDWRAGGGGPRRA